MKELYGKKYYRLDYMTLAKNLLEHNEKLVQVYYFTAYFTQDQKGEKKHRQYVTVLSSLGVRIIFGKFQKVSKMYLKKKNKVIHALWENLIKIFPTALKKLILPTALCYKTREEKRTDVNLATQILIDGVNDLYDKAIIITADSDITPAIEAIKRRNSNKLFTCILPKKDKGLTLSKVCHKTKDITEDMLINAQLPEIVVSKSGKQQYVRPKEWA
jgi:uncharacterized LabA/DUF88 family protein